MSGSVAAVNDRGDAISDRVYGRQILDTLWTAAGAVSDRACECHIPFLRAIAAVQSGTNAERGLGIEQEPQPGDLAAERPCSIARPKPGVRRSGDAVRDCDSEQAPRGFV